MGYKTALFAISPRVPREDVHNQPEGGIERARAAAERWFPHRLGDEIGTLAWDQGEYGRPEDELWVSTFGDTVVFGGSGAQLDEDELTRAAAKVGLSSWQLVIHSAVDLCFFDVHDVDGKPLRKLEMAAEIDFDEVQQTAVGEPLPFEVPYWNGQHDDVELAADGYPHPFHPLGLGEAAVTWMFGVAGEGAPADEVQESLQPKDSTTIPMHGWKLRPAQ